MTMVEIDHSQSKNPISRRERKRRQTRDSLYKAALKLFEIKGFDATTVQQITDAADAGKGTFFHHFPTKDHVLAAYWDDFNHRLLDALETIEANTTRARLLTAMEIFGKAAQKEPAIGRVLLGRVFISPAMMHSDQENEARLCTWLNRVLEDGIERGELLPDADLESFRHLFIANLSSTFREYLLSGGGDPADLMSRRTRLLLRSVENTR